MSGAGAMALLTASGLASQAWAAAATPESGSNVEEVIVTGTRTTGVKAIDSAAPVQVVGAAALKEVGQPDLVQALSQNLPSFNAQSYGSDTAALTLQAALRGLNPNDTLVLVDGKRRHTTANLSVDAGTPFSGSATTDLSFIPVSAIDHIEVLQDGAAAQYGSDAIAGVVNIILKNADHGGSVSATAGQYYEGDGDTGAWSVNKGFSLGPQGFVNVTLEERYHDFSRQGGADYRLSNPNGTPRAGVDPVNAAGLLGASGQPDVNNIYGDTNSNIYNGLYNAGYHLGNGLELYSFGSYGNRVASAFENYRVPNRVTANEGLLVGGAIEPGAGPLVIPFPNGFSPREEFKEYDFSATGGIRGVYDGFHWDLSTTYGEDHDEVYTINSANPGLFEILQGVETAPILPQRNFYDGSFQTTEWTNTVDIVRDFNVGLASPLNIAFGAEQRRDTFRLSAGEPASYVDGGVQSFIGYFPSNQENQSRDSEAGYIDFAVDPIQGLHVDLAGRVEHYSDFGATEVGKATFRYDFNPMIAIRGTISSGFRAPTLAEEFYSGTNVAPGFAFGQLPANSPAALLAGFHPLKPEQSDNYSIGFVAHPIERLQVTVDFYDIELRDRIINTGDIVGFDASHTPATISQNVLNALNKDGDNLDLTQLTYAGIQVFTNGANTRTQGVEMTANYSSDFEQYGHVDWSLGFNYNDTSITKVFALPTVDANPGYGQTSILTANSISALTTAAPREKAILAGFWTLGPWSVNLRETVYGETSEMVSFNGTGSGAGATDVRIGVTGITDLDVSYKITRALRLDIGANNLFDTRPTNIPTINGSGVLRPADGNNVFGEPAGWSPFGINGGYYYGRITYSF
jgi:iron complex outermembrane recepter protein